MKLTIEEIEELEQIDEKVNDARPVSKAELYLKENNIDYTYEEGFNGIPSLRIDKFVYYPMSKRWTFDGKDRYYWPQGIEDFIERFCKYVKKEKI